MAEIPSYLEVATRHARRVAYLVVALGVSALTRHAIPAAHCPINDFELQIEGWEHHGQTNAGLIQTKSLIIEALHACTDAPHLSMLWSFRLRQSSLPSSVCPDHEAFWNDPDLDAVSWRQRRILEYKHCKFERYEVLKNDELNDVGLPQPHFWLGVDELYRSGLSADLARRVARLLLLAHDAESRAPERHIIQRGALLNREYRPRPERWPLDSAGRTKRIFEDPLPRFGAPPTLSIDADATGRDLRWLFDYCQTSNNCDVIYLAATRRRPANTPAVVQLRHAVGSLDPDPRAPPRPLVHIQESGVDLIDADGRRHELRPDHEAELDPNLDQLLTAKRIYVAIDPDVKAGEFFPILLELDSRLGENHPWLILLE